MHSGDILADSARAAQVWRRVTGEAAEPREPAPSPETGDAILLRFLEEEAADARFYALMAAKTSGAAARTFSSLASGSRGRLQALRAAYYLETGETFSPYPACAVAQEPRLALRLRYAEEGSRGEAYRNAAASAGSPSLAALYRRYAEESGDRQEALFRLCRRMIR